MEIIVQKLVWFKTNLNEIKLLLIGKFRVTKVSCKKLICLKSFKHKRSVQKHINPNILPCETHRALWKTTKCIILFETIMYTKKT